LEVFCSSEGLLKAFRLFSHLFLVLREVYEVNFLAVTVVEVVVALAVAS
jgi:hypothetical protein